ncbi:MAG: hypothetical protein EX271_09035 [Acidimicrobiales bacterium]|nr:hypothetical protein [Hyphomonadaceae bacterium]RZV40965.1 MAG: hypothetical protein EX271_09035 [Acidimicrobiales bacterium]
MGVSVRIVDEHFGKSKLSIFDLQYPSDTVTMRELITRRVEEEVAQVNHMKRNPDRIKAEHRMFLAGLTRRSPEVLLNPDAGGKKGKPVDAAAAVKTALKAFDAGSFFVLFNDKQYENLDDQIVLTPNSEVVFLRLTPLIGG